MSYLKRVLFAFSIFLTSIALSESRVINGYDVDNDEYPAVIKLEMNSGALCTGVIVGEQVIMTAAHCSPKESEALFAVDGDIYRVQMHASPTYNEMDLVSDIALGVVNKAIKNAKPVPVDTSLHPKEGSIVDFLGYGCTESGGKGDGSLRLGRAKVVKSLRPGEHTFSAKGAAACFGDSGGPAIFYENGMPKVVGITSAGNIKDHTIFGRLDTVEAKKFFVDFAKNHNVSIEGVSAP